MIEILDLLKGITAFSHLGFSVLCIEFPLLLLPLGEAVSLLNVREGILDTSFLLFSLAKVHVQRKFAQINPTSPRRFD